MKTADKYNVQIVLIGGEIIEIVANWNVKNYVKNIIQKEYMNEDDINGKLDNIVKEVIEKLKIEYDVEVLEEIHHISADSDNYGMDYEIWEVFNGKAKYKENTFEFYVNSDNAGNLDSVESILSYFVHKYINEKEIKSDSIIRVVEYHERNGNSDGQHYYRQWYTIGNHDVDELLYALKNNKVEIKIVK